MNFRIVQIIFAKYPYPDFLPYALPILSTYTEIWSGVSGSFICILQKKNSSGDSDTPINTHTQRNNTFKGQW